MSRTAVLICVAAGAPGDLLLRALRSTAAGLSTDDAFFLFSDGGDPPEEPSLPQACLPASLKVFRSPARKGLAHGLNTLIAVALADGPWAYFARMDADDVSHPQRLIRQRAYFEQCPETDILGTACHEVDEEGRVLQTKSLPCSHEAIIATLPRRNPMNHPTVMFRRRVFENGLRYREDVGLIEDYYLWSDAAAAGFRLANLPEPLLDFRRDKNFFARRGGWRQAKADYAARVHAMRVLGRPAPGNYLWALAAMGLRCLPAFVQEFLYRHLR